MNLKNEKGVTLLVLAITVIVLLIVTGVTLNNAIGQLGIKNVNNLYADIDSITTKVADYYLKNEELPVFEHPYIEGVESKATLEQLLYSNGAKKEKNIINPNDAGAYYVVDLSKMDNLTLNYGEDYSKWNSTSEYSDNQNLYIINEMTHQVYYPQGIKHRERYYFTKQIPEAVNEISLDDISGQLQISVNSTYPITLDADRVNINANITVISMENINKNTFQYAWTDKDTLDTKTEFTSFFLDDTNSAVLVSKPIDRNLQEYYLWIKALDNNGKECEVRVTVRSS